MQSQCGLYELNLAKVEFTCLGRQTETIEKKKHLWNTQ